jgi:FixJ family two-component response regulator
MNGRGLASVARKALVSRMSEPAVIHIVDDDESVRAALDGLLRTVGLAPAPHASVSEFLAAKKPDVPGCLVLDVRMPGISGLAFQEQLSGLGIRLPVILMTGHGDVAMSVRGMKAGAVDFLTKPFRDQDMLDAVGTAIRRDRVRRDAEAVVTGLQERFTTLSPREREVMFLVTAGKRNKQVADNLGVTEITVKFHRGAAMRKMGAPTLADLVLMAEALQVGNRNDEPCPSC